MSYMAAVDVAPSVAMGMSQVRTQAIRLFAFGFLVLFMELACIRWFATYVIFLQFFTNVILIASFLGMSCGCLAAGRRQEWLHYFPLIGLGAIVAALAASTAYHFWSGLVIDVGSQRSAQEVFFGTEYGNPDVAKFVLPIEAIAAVFFVLVALMFVGLGQVMGRAFDAYPNRVLGYTLNIGGSLAGIIAFSALAFLKAPPAVWFLICCAGIAYLLYQERALDGLKIAALVTLVVLVSMPGDWLRNDGHVRHWSPYYMVDHETATGFIKVNAIGHQQMAPFSAGAAVYSLILHSGYANIRLESYLFTQQAFDDIRRALKPGGTFVTYNFFRQGWIVERIAAMMQETFGCPATVLSLPYQEKLSDSFLNGGFTMIIGGCNPNIAQAFAAKKNFWLDPL